MKVSLLLISLFSFASISKDFKPNMEELKLNKIKETKKSYSAGESVPYKRVSNASRLSNIEVKGVTNTNREQNLKRYIQLNKEESEDSTTLKLSLNYLEPKLKDPNKYRIKSVNYHFGDGNIQNTALANVNGEDFIILDISSLNVGSYTASIELVIQKNEDLRASGNKNKSGSDFKPILLTYSVEFEKVDSAFLVVNEYLRPEGLWAIGLDLSESYSEGGEILNYKVETFFEGELDFSATITFNRFSISFNQVGEWKIIITMTDSLGDTDTKELIYNVTNARPRLEYTYTFNEELQGAIDIDMSGSSDDGGEIVEYASFFLNDGQFSNYDSHGPKITRLLLRPGINRVCLRIVDNDGVDRVNCFNVEFNDEILPIYYLNGIEETGFDPRFYFVDNACVIPDGRELKEFVIEYNNGVDFREVRTQEEYFDIFIPSPGTWNLTAYCLDSNNVQSNIVNYELNAEFDLGKPEAYVELGPLPFEEDQTQRIYATTRENSMPSPFANFITQYNYSFKNLNSGETFNVNRDFAYGDIFFPSYGTWEVTYTVIDELGLVSDPYVFTVDVVRPLIPPTAEILIIKNENVLSGLEYFVKDELSIAGSAPISKYTFNFHKRDSLEQFTLTPSQPFISFSFPSFGIWDLSYTVTNEDNLTSPPQKYTFDLKPILPTANVILARNDNDNSGLVYTVASETSSIGSGSSLIEYNYELLNLNTGELYNLTFNQAFIDIEFPSSGLWSINYTVKNNLELLSEPFFFTLDVEELFKPQLDFFIFAINAPYKYGIEITEKSFKQDDPFIKYIASINDISIEFNTNQIQLPIFTESGEIEVSLVGITQSGKQTDSISKKITITIETIGSDIIPNDPGDTNNIDIAGIDSDEDGVRDDVELIINKTLSNESSSLRSRYLASAKTLQNYMSITDSPNQLSNNDIIKIKTVFSNLASCLRESGMFKNEEDINYFVSNLKRAQFNTFERINWHLNAMKRSKGIPYRGDESNEVCNL